MRSGGLRAPAAGPKLAAPRAAATGTTESESSLSDQSQGQGWWQASDGKWYPPQPAAAEPPAQQPPASQPTQSYPSSGQPGQSWETAPTTQQPPVAPQGPPTQPGQPAAGGPPQYGQPQYGQPAQPAPGYGQQPGYGQAYQQPNAYAQPQYTAAPYAAAPVGQSSKSKLAAGLLGIFLGGLGVHNFYLGNTGKAVAQLLLTLVGWILLGLGPIAAAIWGFVEGIIILCSKPGSPWHKDANGYELSD